MDALYVNASITAKLSSGKEKKVTDTRQLFFASEYRLRSIKTVCDYQETLQEMLLEYCLTWPFEDIENFIYHMRQDVQWINEKVEEGWELEFYHFLD